MGCSRVACPRLLTASCLAAPHLMPSHFPGSTEAKVPLLPLCWYFSNILALPSSTFVNCSLLLVFPFLDAAWPCDARTRSLFLSPCFFWPFTLRFFLMHRNPEWSQLFLLLCPSCISFQQLLLQKRHLLFCSSFLSPSRLIHILFVMLNNPAEGAFSVLPPLSSTASCTDRIHCTATFAACSHCYLYAFFPAVLSAGKDQSPTHNCFPHKWEGFIGYTNGLYGKILCPKACPFFQLWQLI